MNELVQPRGGLSATHADARRLGEASVGLLTREDMLFGRRGIKRPLVAITTKKELGNCRHALSQMVVAGVMTVMPPMRPGQPADPAPSVGPRVLTFTPPPPKEPEEGQAPVAVKPPAPPVRPAPAATPAPAARALPAPRSPSVVAPRPAAGVAARVPPASKGPAPVVRGDRVVTVERKILEDFNLLPKEDE